jgi:hypothetical protein
MTVQWGLDLPLVGTINARFILETGADPSTAFVDEFVKTIAFSWTVMSTFLRTGDVADMELREKMGLPKSFGVAVPWLEGIRRCRLESW